MDKIITYISTVFVIISLSFSSCTKIVPTPTEKRVIKTTNAPGAIGIYSQAIEAGNTLYLSGQIGILPETKELVGDDIQSQTHQALKNVSAILKASGYEMKDVVSAQVFVADMNDYAAFNEVYVEYFPDNPPARAVVEVSRIPLDAKVEIKTIAVH
ncbi:RidA family protein [Balneola sp. MJW-20]|uniref:RidA family protein n=1 Tax=Gracilimonas aurantiaca TaxID=3234185 RepID=UPI003466CBAE